MRKEENEIDLLELLAKIYFLFKRNKYIILAFIIIGVIVGIYKSTGSEAYYKTNMVAKSPLSEDEIIEQLQSLSELQQKNNPKLLSEELNLNLNEARKIKFLKVEKTEEKSNLIQIKLEVFTNNLIPKIKEGIIQYLNTNPYVKRELEDRQEHYEEYLEKITEALEILREKENKKDLPQEAKAILVSEESYSGQIIRLMNKKGNIEENLRNNQPLIIIKDFNIPETPQKDIKFQIALYTIIGFILGIIVVFSITLLKKLENYKKE